MADPRVVNRIKYWAQQLGVPQRYLVGAFATGIVESNLEDLEGGDADSYGFRQQRESIYGRQDLDTQIKNLFKEFRQFDKGQPIGELVADVQRPAEQYRGRYAEVLGQAQKLAGGGNVDLGGGGGNGSAAPAAVPQQAKQNPFDTIGSLGGQQEGPYADIMDRGWDLLGQIWDKKYGAPATPTTLPSVGGGGGGVGGGKIPAGGKISEGLAEAFYDPVGGYDAGQSIGPIGGHGTHAHFGGQPGAIANVVRRAQKPKWGLTVREYAPVDPVDPVHTEGSWHDKFEGRGGADISGDPERLDDFFKMILRRAGWK